MPTNVVPGTERQINQNSGLDGATGSQADPDIAALIGGGYAVAYENPGTDIFYQRLNPDGSLTGATFGLALPGIQTASSVAGRADGGFVGVYASFFDNGTTNTHELRLDDFAAGSTTPAGAGPKIIEASSAATGVPLAISFEDPDVARLASGQLLVVYERRDSDADNGDIRFNTYDPATGIAGAPVPLTDTATLFESSVAVAANTATDTALVVYQAEQADGSSDIHARLFSGTTPGATTFTAAGLGSDRGFGQPDVAALIDGRYVIVWEEDVGLDRDVTGAIYNPASNGFTPFAVDAGSGLQARPRVAGLPGGGFVVTWDDSFTGAGDTDPRSIRGQRFDSAGAAVGDVFLVNTTTSESQLEPTIAAHPDGRFAIMWRDFSQQLTTAPDIGGRNFALPDTAGLLGAPITGTAGDDILFGTSLSEVISGLNGDDFIRAGRGNDTVFGGAGLNLIRGEGGNDSLFGNSGDDLLFGQDGTDTLRGSSGNDRLDGGTSNDRLFGESGGDLLLGRAGNDTLDGSSGNDVLLGEDGNDTLLGGTGSDRLDGGNGNDLLVGGRDADLLIGRAGRDIFDFNSIAESRRGPGHDTVIFRRVDGDRIDLRSIDADSDTRGNQRFTFIGSAAFSDSDGELRFSRGLLQGDVNGDGRADIEIRVSGALLAGDILL
jgi:Ca2+-binding RTX toxin-like protein